MPELPILDADGRLLNEAPLIVEALKMHPDNPEAGMQYLANQLAGFIGLNPPERLPRLIRVLAAAPSNKEVLRRAARATDNAWIASMALCNMLRARINHPDYPVDASRMFWALSQVNPEVVPADRSRWRLWSKYRPVAHLALASGTQLIAHGFSPEKLPGPEFIYTRFDEFLGLASFLGRLAVQTGILDLDEIWRVPKRLEVPEINVPLPELPQPVLNALRSYIPPSRGSEGIEE